MAVAAIAIVLALLLGGRASGQAGAPEASGFDVVKFPGPQPGCTGVGLRNSLYFAPADCGFANVEIAGAPETATVEAVFFAQDGTEFATAEAFFDTGTTWQFDITPEPSWPAGKVTIRMRVDADAGGPGPFVAAAGEGSFFLGQLGAALAPVTNPGGYRPGDPIPLEGRIFEKRSVGIETQETGVTATFRLRTVDASGDVRGPFDPVTASSNGNVAVTLPAAATAGIDPGRSTNFREAVRIELVDASYNDPGLGPPPDPGRIGTWRANNEPAGSATVSVTPDELILENSFVSSVGWVKPGENYPFTLRVKNFDDQPKTGAVVSVAAPDSTALSEPPGPAASVAGNVLTWDVGDMPAATAAGPAVKQLVGEATADTFAEDAQVVWKDLSTNATLSYDSGPSGIATRSHGPKVIPPNGGYETARYGDRPFPVVPVDYNDRAHAPGSSSSKLASTINDPSEPGSTFNLFQEISYGQLFPNGTVPSDGVATAGWEYDHDFEFTQNTLDPDTCRGSTNANLGDSYQDLQPERIRNGWYQLPGSTDYYGDDSNGSAVIGSVAGVGALQDIDSACGPTGKAVFDAAQIADPEIDYSDYDTDKDGVVDFFMMVYAGEGGNGVSQTTAPPYDNIWPHSSDLRNSYTDEATGLTGYVSDDQLRNLESEPLWYTNASRTETTTANTGDDLKVFVRVGPYNVNPESAIEKASVISHEYGHSLGLPDYYSTGGRETYGSWNLMATDYSQNMDVIGKKELGWVVPRVLDQDTQASGWQDTKRNTHRIDWQTPGGQDYTLSGADVNNGEAYVASLPGRQIIDPATVPSGDHLWWSGSGNDFGCVPDGGHNIDIALPGLAEVPAGETVTLTFKSRFDIEWDYDYGFVMSTADNGESYQSYASEQGYTTPAAQNPNQNACQGTYGNGITGSSGSYEQGTQDVDRVAGSYPGSPFVDDEYDLSELAGEPATLRFSYATDPGLARPGWFIDDVKVTAGDQVLYESDFETANEDAIFNGGCSEGLQTAAQCTAGWQYVSAADGDPAEHAYLLEMRDRSGFDAHGRDESDRGDLTFAPGALLTYTDENHGYGNVGTDDPPAQSPLDSQPEPESATPNLDDAAFTAAAGDSRFSDSGEGHVDNYSDPSREDGLWRFDYNCLTFDVATMVGTDVGPDTVPLTYTRIGDVNFDIGSDCGPFNYGTAPIGPGGQGDLAPTAIAQARPTTAQVGETVSFDGSSSFDDFDAPESLGFAWDFNGDGNPDADAREATHVYDTPGEYTAALTVRDSGGKTATDTVAITVTGGGDGGGGNGGNGDGTKCKGLEATILGTAANDSLRGTREADVIVARGGKDRIKGRGGADVICGKGGNDKRLTGGGGRDRMFGGGGDDKLRGGTGRDRLDGGNGDDNLGGGPGFDRLRGGRNIDRCKGGETTDRTRSCER